jgi:hemolysin-activating ACP:hemolysin acyltransferase|tara:strand:+ start:304 stop:705 length:402 start_codon:yes stop_codon:yes gene_type:complete
MSKFKDLQSVLIFMLDSPLHKTWTVEEICRCILLPILLDQYKIIYEKGKPVVFGTWGFPKQEHIDKYLKTLKFPRYGYDGGGKNVWMIDFIAEKDYTLKGVRYFKYFFTEKGYNKVSWLRVRNKKLSWHKWRK